MSTTASSRYVRRFGLGAMAAAGAMVLAAPTASAAEARLTMSSDNGTYSVWSTYSLTVTADPAMQGTATFCTTVDRITTCYKPIQSSNGIATMQWTPSKQGTYEIEAKYVYAAPDGPNGSYGLRARATIRVYCPGHQGQSWNCPRP
ncbi:hypothetical protein SAMN04244553_2013 [Nocardia amikacinitolerans]|uniref:Ig-like domain-containing protein n=1 Tax=Nocardia amikacinitolerans TaxID=756689 RepID=A0A285L668_9NOCA|nr:hypothetical protein SAMN04244553_2013 [Nocardia amikacinitolerans]